ncbi:MAG: hypothetical protein LBU11_02925 [Zoogloeaceae bacterium]|nr:hypothetical protein [Zoogloeaceae bacterium]
MHAQIMDTRTVPIMSQPLHDKRRDDVANALGDSLPDMAFDAFGNVVARGNASENVCRNFGEDVPDMGDGLLDGIGGTLADAAGVVMDAAGAVFEHLVDGL